MRINEIVSKLYPETSMGIKKAHSIIQNGILKND